MSKLSGADVVLESRPVPYGYQLGVCSSIFFCINTDITFIHKSSEYYGPSPTTVMGRGTARTEDLGLGNNHSCNSIHRLISVNTVTILDRYLYNCIFCIIYIYIIHYSFCRAQSEAIDSAG